MAEIDDILLSRVTLLSETGSELGDFDLSFLVEMTLTETIDVSGPRFVLVMDDPMGYLADDLQARENCLLRVSFSSHWYEGQEIDLTMTFRILTMPRRGRALVFNCLEKEIHTSKQPAKTTTVLRNLPMATMIKRLVPALPVDAGKVPVWMDYHVLPGTRPSKTLRQMCHEMQAACFNQRGTMVFKTWAEMLKQPVSLTYHRTPPPEEKAQGEIYKYSVAGCSSIVKDRTERNYTSWNTTKGVVTTGQVGEFPPEWVSPPLPLVLDNMLSVPVPTLDLIVVGNGLLRAGIMLELKWHTDEADRPVDESLPDRVLVSVVSHYYSNGKYLARIKGVRCE